MCDFIKERVGAPRGFFAAEAAGLRWLAEPDVVPVVDVINYGASSLQLDRIEETAPDASSAFSFGRQLALLHDSGALAFGWAPAEPAWFGPLDSPFEVEVASCASFTEFWVQTRLEPMATDISNQLSNEQREMITSAISAISAGSFEGIAGQGREKPSRVHGDLWAGNLMWTPSGCTLIDPAAHGGHRLEDLAMLALFGTPFLDEIFTGYEAAHPMPDGWRRDLPAHSFFALLAHVKLFGAGFLGQTLTAARAIIDRGQELSA
ncbi:fructosamine kinase family protein [Brevibacterium sp. ZH18]|uniref:fructosamine kinase family protein n=1 Tax=Brevibacterium sp. ZH18 TaxID=2927784 RepID=UPI001F623BB5|nr:fructosamine kinase family protein [Brevibacterium sp. ZH18]MCI4012974.1 fructosamine kinase family protein [Brevibacterium sp. ZH18]